MCVEDFYGGIDPAAGRGARRGVMQFAGMMDGGKNAQRSCDALWELEESGAI